MLYRTKLLTLTLSLSKQLVDRANHNRIKTNCGLTLAPYLLILIEQGLKLPNSKWGARVFDLTESDEVVVIECQTRNAQLFDLSQLRFNDLIRRALDYQEERNYDN